MQVGTRVGFRLAVTTTAENRERYPRHEITVHGHVTSMTPGSSEQHLINALAEIEQLVNTKLPHMRLHISEE